jgi:hypothetical protein
MFSRTRFMAMRVAVGRNRTCTIRRNLAQEMGVADAIHREAERAAAPLAAADNMGGDIVFSASPVTPSAFRTAERDAKAAKAKKKAPRNNRARSADDRAARSYFFRAMSPSVDMTHLGIARAELAKRWDELSKRERKKYDAASRTPKTHCFVSSGDGFDPITTKNVGRKGVIEPRVAYVVDNLAVAREEALQRRSRETAELAEAGVAPASSSGAALGDIKEAVAGLKLRWHVMKSSERERWAQTAAEQSAGAWGRFNHGFDAAVLGATATDAATPFMSPVARSIAARAQDVAAEV